jgi:hypothetical protein
MNVQVQRLCFANDDVDSKIVSDLFSIESFNNFC